MKSLLKMPVLLTSLAVSFPGAAGPNSYPVYSVPADPSAKYEAVSVIERSDGLVEFVSRRTGKSGVSFSKRLIDCTNWRAGYLVGDADTLDEIRQSKKTVTELGPLISGSSTHSAVVYACASLAN